MRVVAGRYERGELLGEGGTARVYAARDRRTGQAVALKVFRPDCSPFEDFRREARLLAEVDDPGFVRVLGAVDTASREPTLVLERAPGAPIAAVVAAGDERQTLIAIAEVARALARLHARGMIHGDLRSSNVFAEATASGLRVRLLDFGLAGRAGSPGSLSGDIRSLSPARLRGETATASDDLWALGVLGLRLFLGHEPLAADGATGAATMAAILRGDLAVAAQSIAARAPALATLLELLLGAARPRSADEVARAAAESAGLELAAVDGARVLIGRDAAIASFRAVLERVRAGASAEFVVAGVPGSGRSALLQRFELECRLAEVESARTSGADAALDRVATPPPPAALLVDDVADDESAGLANAIAEACDRPPRLLVVATGAAGHGRASATRVALEELRTNEIEELVACRIGDRDAAIELARRLTAEGRRQPGSILDALATLARQGLLLRRHGRSHLAPGYERSWTSALAERARGRVRPLSPARALAEAGKRRLRGDLEGAAALLEEALDRAPDDPAARLALAEVEAARGRPESARRHFRRVLRAAAGLESSAGASRGLAMLDQSLGRSRSAERQLRQLLSRLQRARGSWVKRERALAATSLAYLLRGTGRLDEARRRLEAALRAAARDAQLRAALLVDLGHVELAAGRLATARRAYAEALRRAGAIKKTAADAENGLGLIELGGAQPKRAIAHFRRAAQRFRAGGWRSQAGRALNNVGIAAFLTGDTTTALDAWERAEALALLRGDEGEAARVGTNRGLALARSGQPERGRAVLERALTRFESLNDGAGAAETLANLSEAYRRAGDAATALTFAERAVDAARAAGTAGRSALGEASLRRAEAYFAAGRVDDAARELDAAEAATGPERIVLAAHIAAARGERESALAQLELARHQLRQAGRFGEAARIALERAELLLADGRSAEARRLAAEAERGLGVNRLAADAARLERLRRGLDGGDEGLRQRFAILEETIRSLTELRDLDDALARLLSRALELSDADRALVLLLDERGHPVFRGARDRQGRALAGVDFPMSLTVANEALARGEAVAVADAATEERFRNQQSVRELGLHAIAGLPIKSGGRSIGLLYVDSVRRSDFLAGERLELLETLAGAAGAAIESARARERESRRRDLIAIAAHELQTPAASVQTIAQLLAPDAPTDAETAAELRDTLDRIARRMRTTIANILDLTRLESGSTETVRRPLSIPTLVEEAILVSRPLAASRGISLASSLPAIFPSAEGDFDRLVQVLVNLIGNALRYSPDGSAVSVEAGPPRAGSRAPAGKSVVGGRLLRVRDWIELRVVDRGPGVPEAERDRIFEKFERGSGATKSIERGAGLGLAISREIVRQHGGELFVEARVGGGSEFVVRLPGRA